MSDMENAASNAAVDTSLPDSQATPNNESPIDSAPSTRDAVSRAFARVVEGTPESGTKAARERDEAGRFAAKPSDAPQTRDATEAPVATSTVPPPPRFTKAAQAEWARVPEPVRAEVARMESELTQGIEKYRSSAESFEPVRRFDEMAKAGGTTLEAALTAYTNMENGWRKDPAIGFVAVCQNMGVDPVAQAKAIYERLAGAEGLPKGDSPEVAALKQQIAALEAKVGTVNQFVEQQQQAPMMQKVVEFSQTAPFFDLLATDIVAEIKTIQARGGQPDLQQVYDAAVARHPKLSAVIAAEKAAKAAPKQPPEAQTRKASLSITGNPSAGSNPSSMKPAGSTLDALKSAFQQVGIT